MNTEPPCSDYVEVRGVVFLARMLHKIRLKHSGRLPEGYSVGVANPTCFDARFCRYWGVDFERISALVLSGKTDEEVFNALFEGRYLSPEHILCWNSFIVKRGWRDGVAEELEREKLARGLGDRADIQTFVDFHDVDEGRRPRYALRDEEAVGSVGAVD